MLHNISHTQHPHQAVTSCRPTGGHRSPAVDRRFWRLSVTDSRLSTHDHGLSARIYVRLSGLDSARLITLHLTSCPNNFTLIYDNAILRRDVDCDVSSCFHRPVKTLRQITKKLYKSVGTFLLTAMYPGKKQASTYAQSPYTSQARTASTALMAYLDSRLLAECRWCSQRRHYNPSDRRWRYWRWCGWCRRYWR